jgi:asparagine synthase (glutamine-hydrolysing)
MKARRFIRAANLSSDEAHFGWRMICDDALKDKLYPFNGQAAPAFSFSQPCFARAAQAPFLNRMLYADMCYHLPNDILAKVDRMSMAHGLEVRVPFLDREVVEFAFRVPPSLKLRFGIIKKYLLRRAMHTCLPFPIRHRPKRGFNVPIGSWLCGSLRTFMCETLSPAEVRGQGLFDVKVVTRLIDEHLAGVRDNSYELWSLIVLMVWWRSFFRQVSPALPAQ